MCWNMFVVKLQKKRIAMTKNRNASTSAFGWDFQSNAAILLMLENIEMAESVKVEGQTEDVEITLNNNNITYSQAKSIEDINSTNNLLQKLKDAMKTLNDASKENNVEKLIYITNHPNPFNDSSTAMYFGNGTSLSFSELPEVCQGKISKIVTDYDYNIDLDKLYVEILLFHGENERNRYKHIKEVVSEFLSQADIYENYNAQRVLDLWRGEFFVNSTIKNPTIQITKKKMMWSL